MNHLRDFQEYSKIEIDFDTIDMEFYYGFVDYMTKIKRGISIQSVSK